MITPEDLAILEHDDSWGRGICELLGVDYVETKMQALEMLFGKAASDA